MDIPQCGNLAIFQLLWFCMKIILADFKRSKTVMWTISEALNFVFLGISHLKIWKISTNSKFRVAHMVKIAVFWASKWSKLTSCKIDVWVAENPDILTFCLFPIRLPMSVLVIQSCNCQRINKIIVIKSSKMSFSLEQCALFGATHRHNSSI